MLRAQRAQQESKASPALLGLQARPAQQEPQALPESLALLDPPALTASTASRGRKARLVQLALPVQREPPEQQGLLDQPAQRAQRARPAQPDPREQPELPEPPDQQAPLALRVRLARPARQEPQAPPGQLVRQDQRELTVSMVSTGREARPDLQECREPLHLLEQRGRPARPGLLAQLARRVQRGLQELRGRQARQEPMVLTASTDREAQQE